MLTRYASTVAVVLKLIASRLLSTGLQRKPDVNAGQSTVASAKVQSHFLLPSRPESASLNSCKPDSKFWPRLTADVDADALAFWVPPCEPS